MITTKRAPSRNAPRAGKKRRAAKRAPYHHGSLREAMLRAAESILERDGIRGLTLRAAAREAGVSHAAPKNHFGDHSVGWHVCQKLDHLSPLQSLLGIAYLLREQSHGRACGALIPCAPFGHGGNPRADIAAIDCRRMRYQAS